MENKVKIIKIKLPKEFFEMLKKQKKLLIELGK